MKKFRHAGNCGDIVYSLGVVMGCGVGSEYYLHLDQPASYTPGVNHPLGTVTLKREWAEMLIPLLEEQVYIKKCAIWDGEEIDVDLSSFRKQRWDFAKGDIRHWYNWQHSDMQCCDLSMPTITVEPNMQYYDAIVVNATNRYESYAKWEILNNVKEPIVFVGLPEEFRAFSTAVIGASYCSVKNYLELAQVIGGSKCFVGNQSFCWSLAEAMKIDRILLACTDCPNCSPIGEGGYQAVSNQGFINSLKALGLLP